MPKNRAIVILKNTISNYLRHIVDIIVFLIYIPFVVKILGTDNFGIWSLLMATVGILKLADIGFTTSTVKYVADARGRGDIDRLRHVVATLFWVYLGLGMVLMAIALVLLPFLPGILSIPDQYHKSARWVFLLIAIRAALAMPLGMFLNVLQGFQKQMLSNKLRMIESVSYTTFVLLALLWFPTLETMACLSLLSNLGINVYAMVTCLYRMEGVAVSKCFFSREMVKEIFSFSLYHFMIQVSGLIYMKVDTLIIQAFLTLADVSLYTVASRISEKAATFCRQLVNALTPMIAELQGAGDESNIRVIWVKGSKLSVAMAVPLLVGLVWFTEDLLVVWMGEEFRNAALPCRILILTMLSSVIHANSASVLSMTGHQKFLAFSFFGGQMFNLALTIVFIRIWGLKGVAYATLIANLLVDVLFVQRRASSVYSVSLIRFYGKSVCPSLPACALMLGGIWLSEWTIAPTSLLRIAILEAMGCAIFAAGFWLLGMTIREREYYRSRILKFFRRKTENEAEKTEKG